MEFFGKHRLLPHPEKQPVAVKSVDVEVRRGRDFVMLRYSVEPADTLRYAASGAKKNGILRLPERGLHIELPRAARAEWREAYTAILADFLVQAAALAAGR